MSFPGRQDRHDKGQAKISVRWRRRLLVNMERSFARLPGWQVYGTVQLFLLPGNDHGLCHEAHPLWLL